MAPRSPQHVRLLSRLVPLKLEELDLEGPRKLYPDVVAAAARYDPRIVIFYDRRVALYGIARFPERGGEPVLQTWWCTEDNGFKRLGMELVGWLQACDKRRLYDSADEQDRRERASDDGRHDKTRRDFADDIDHITRSNRRQLGRLKSDLLSI